MAVRWRRDGRKAYARHVHMGTGTGTGLNRPLWGLCHTGCMRPHERRTRPPGFFGGPVASKAKGLFGDDMFDITPAVGGKAKESAKPVRLILNPFWLIGVAEIPAA